MVKMTLLEQEVCLTSINFRGVDMVDQNEPFEIEHGGNAFMMIRRDCFETLKPILPYILMEEDLYLTV